MRYYAGIDEAGYGPLLGPLVISSASFRILDQSQRDQLWNFTKTSVAARASDAAAKPMVADSKIVMRGSKGFRRLEETVFTFLSLFDGPRPRTLHEILFHLAGEVDDSYPWYRDCGEPLPRRTWTNVCERHGIAVKSDLAAHGCSFEGVRCAVIREGEFNKLIDETSNKGAAEWRGISRLLSDIMERYGPEGVYVDVDRLGGRGRYGRLLFELFYGAKIKIIEQSEGKSAYRVSSDAGKMEISFEVESDRRHFPVALASIFSKYIREVHMEELNRYFRAFMPELKPTAGYVQDGRRFLDDTKELRAQLAVPDQLLVRCR